MPLSKIGTGSAAIGAVPGDGPTFRTATRKGDSNTCVITYGIPAAADLGGAPAKLYLISKPGIGTDGNDNPFAGYTPEQVVAEAEVTRDLIGTDAGQDVTVEIENDLERTAENEFSIAVVETAAPTETATATA